MCEINPIYGFSGTAGYPPGPGAHDQLYNGDNGHGHHGLHENGRGPAHHQQYQQLGYGPQGPSYPRFPPYDRIPDHMRPIDGTNAHLEPSPYYGAQAVPPQQPPPPAQALAQQQSQYDTCGSRPSITPPHEQPLQYPSCKMQPVHSHNDISPPSGLVGSPPPQHPAQHQMYPGPPPSPGQGSAAAMNSSPLYPWMRSQFGECRPNGYRSAPRAPFPPYTSCACNSCRRAGLGMRRGQKYTEKG